MVSNFCNEKVTLEDWYAVCKSKEVKSGKSLGLSCGNQPLLIKRFKDGKLVAYERYCSHMGADLSLAKEVDNTIQCAFHGLCFDKEGKCKQKCDVTSLYNLKIFPVVEKYNLIFVYLGEKPRYEIPELHFDKGPLFYSPSQKISAHHHIVICNGLDSVHTYPVHSFKISDLEVETTGNKVRAHLTGVYKAWWMMLLNNTYRKSLTFTFTSYGSAISVADVKWHKTRLVIFFTARQDENNKCHTNTGLYLDTYNPIDWIRGAIVVFGILYQDAKLLSQVSREEVKQNFTKLDVGVSAYRDVLDATPVYHKFEKDTEFISGVHNLKSVTKR